MMSLPVFWPRMEDFGVWPDGLLDAYNAMIPKTDGDATPLGQRPLQCAPDRLSYLGICSYGSA